MIKRILIPLDPSVYTETALEMACFMAKHHHAELTGMVVLDVPGIEKAIEPAPVGAIHFAEKLEKHKEEEAEERIEQLLEKFKTFCEQKGLRHRESEKQGGPSKRIIHESAYYDVVIIGMQTFFHFETTDKPGRMLQEMMDHTVTPIFSVLKNYSFPDPLDRKIRVLVCFDGSLAATRAVQQFVHLALPDFMEVLLLTSEDNHGQAYYRLDQVKMYLKAYGFDRVSEKVVSEKIMTAMHHKYLDWSDLIVMGAHSKIGILDFFMGSLTQNLLKLEKKPLLIGQ